MKNDKLITNKRLNKVMKDIMQVVCENDISNLESIAITFMFAHATYEHILNTAPDKEAKQMIAKNILTNIRTVTSRVKQYGELKN